MNYSTLKYGIQEQLFTALVHVQHRMGELANSPALPEMVRPSFQNLSQELSSALQMSRVSAELDMLAGTGPQATLLRNVSQYLGVEPKGDLSHLQVYTSFKSDAPVDAELAQRVWTQFFRTEYPTEMFKRGEDRRKNQLVMDVPLFTYQQGHNSQTLTGTVTIVLDATVDEDGPWPETALIKEINVSYGTVEGYWTAFVSVLRTEVLFNPHVKLQAHVVHHVEKASCSFELEGAVEFLQWYIVDALRDKLGFKFEDFKQAPDARFGYSVLDELYNVVDQEPKWARDHLLNRIVSTCSNRFSKSDFVLEVPGVGQITLVTGRNDWSDYTKYQEDIAKCHWARDYPLIKVESITSQGIDMLHRRRPSDWDFLFLKAIIEKFGEIVEKAKSEKYYARLDPAYVKPAEE